MTIIYVITRLNNLGPVNQLYSLIGGIKEKDKDISIKIITMYAETWDSRKEEFLKMGVEVECLALKHKYDLISPRKKFREIINKENPDIVHSMTLPADLLVSYSGINEKKWCVTMHCDIYVDYYTRFNKFIAPIFIKQHEKALNKTSKIICCSYSIQKSYEAKFGEKVCAIQNGIDLSKIVDVMKKDKDELKTKLNIDKEKIVVVTVGSIDERKNSLYIVENFLRMKQDKYHFIFLGEGPLLEACMQKAHGLVDFRGKVQKVEEYLRCADIYVSASKSEGLPLSVIEAACCGKNLVLSDIGPHAEIVKGYLGEGVYFFSNSDPFGIKKTMEKNIMVKDEIKISDYFQSEFSSLRMSCEYIKKYYEIAK